MVIQIMECRMGCRAIPDGGGVLMIQDSSGIDIAIPLDEEDGEAWAQEIRRKTSKSGLTIASAADLPRL